MTALTTDPAEPVVSAAPMDELRHLRRVLLVELQDELRAILREPTAIGFSVIMPVVFFALFVGIFGAEGSTPSEVGNTMLGTFGTFGVLSVTLLNPGIGLASDRERGWLRVKRAAAVPFPVTVVAKVLASLPYAIAVMGAMTGAGLLMGRLDVTGGGVARTIVVLVIGATAFVPIGLTVGSLTTPNTAAAALNAILIPMAIASGLWMPFEVLPDWVASLAPALPAYHLAELAQAQLTGAGSLDHVLVLAGTLVVGAVVFGLTYRRSRP